MSDGGDQDASIDMGGERLEPGMRVGPYVYARPIAAGGMAHVLLAHDPSGQPVALKVLKANRIGSGLMRFRREFRALSRLRHDNVIRVDAYGDIHDHPYIAMEYVEGEDLHQVIRNMSTLSGVVRFARVEQILTDMARALTYIHKRGLVHRDLKPSNILITPDGVAKLTDFGIVKDLDPSADPFVSTTLVGTWAYASPEQISGAPIDHRSDLYSLGVLLYAMLTGRRPFVAGDMGGYLEQHRNKEPLAPSELDAEVPPHLEEICLRLLRKAPRDRYQGAREILQRLDQEVPGRKLDEAGAVSDGPGPDTDEQLWEPPLVGREDELSVLQDTISALTRGAGGVLLIEGPEGSGRSRLYRASLRHARTIGIPVYSARMTARDAGFETLLRIGNDVSRELGARTPRELGASLRSFAEDRGKVAGDLRYQLYDSIRSALALLLQDGPQILAVDDLQHAPPPLLGLIAYLGRSLLERDQSPLLILATIQDGGAAPDLAGIRSGSELGVTPSRLHLAPLTRSQVEMLVQDLLGSSRETPGLAARLHQETGGNPLFVTEFLRSLVQRRTGGLDPSMAAPDDDTAMVPMLDEQDTEVLSAGDLAIPDGVRQVLGARLKQLSPAEREIIAVLAANGREMDLDLLLDVVLGEGGARDLVDPTRLATEVAGQIDPDASLGDGGAEDEVLDLIETLQDRDILVERRAGLQSLVDFSHGRLGEVVYRELTAARKADLHRRIGAALEVREAGNPLAAEVMAEHFRLAGDAGMAYHHLARAALGLWERSLLGEAWKLAERARSLEFKARRDLSVADYDRCRINVLRVRADALNNRGEWVEAREVLSALRGAALVANDDRLADQAGLDLGEVLRRMGRPDEGEEFVQAVLSHARTTGDRPTIIDALLRLARFAFADGDLDRCEGFASQGLVAASGPNLEASRAEMLIALSATQASRGELAAATSGLTEAEGILRGLRNKRANAVVLGNLAELLTWHGSFADAIKRSTDGLSQAADVLYREGEAFLYRVRGVARFEAGDLDGASADLDRSYEICDQLGESSEKAAALYFMARLALRRGKAEQAVAHAEQGLRCAEQHDSEAYAPALRSTLARALCTTGDIDRAESILNELMGQLDTLHLPRRTQVQLNMAAAWAALGLAEEALPLVREAARVAGTRGFRAWALKARILLAELEEEQPAEQARQEAADLARQLLEALPAELAGPFRRQPGFARLWVLRR